MSLFRFHWLHRIIRRNTKPIPEFEAAKTKRYLAVAYALFAWNAFGFVCYAIYSGKSDWADFHGLKDETDKKLSPAQQWAQTLKVNNAEIYRLDGFKLKQIQTNAPESDPELLSKK